MVSKTVKILFAIISACVFLAACDGNNINEESGLPPVLEEKSTVSYDDLNKGYISAVYDGEAFLATGTGGRLDRISVDKNVKNIPVPTDNSLLKIFILNGRTMISGTGGVILYSDDSVNFKLGNTGITSTIYEITFFSGNYFACADNGVILSSKDGMTWKQIQSGTANNIVSIASNGLMVMAITNESEIISTSDGVTWKINNFNKEYEGYYDPYIFTSIKSIGEAFFIVGHWMEDPGTPNVMSSTTGEVWLPQSLYDIDGIDYDSPVSIKINAIDFDQDQILAACDGGRILTISNCYKCHKIEKYLDADIKDIALGGDKLIIVGDDYAFDILDGTAARQYNIKPEQANIDIQNGAVVIDVRTDEEYNQGHILGCLHIPVDQIEKRLPEVVPNFDTEIIFYCGSGKRSQTALETALQLGYQRVYNLGAFSDWPYETE